MCVCMLCFCYHVNHDLFVWLVIFHSISFICFVLFSLWFDFGKMVLLLMCVSVCVHVCVVYKYPAINNNIHFHHSFISTTKNVDQEKIKPIKHTYTHTHTFYTYYFHTHEQFWTLILFFLFRIPNTKQKKHSVQYSTNSLLRFKRKKIPVFRIHKKQH